MPCRPLTDSRYAWYKRFKSSYMAIRAPFRLLLAGLVGIFSPIAISPACAESQSPSSDFFEVSVPTVPADEFSPAPAIDTKPEGPSLQDDPSVWVPDDFDPWAYAFAESSRLQARSVRFVKAPTYSVATNNSQVKYFVDRFTTNRRDVVGLWVRRSGHYLSMIFDVFRAKGLPEDLAFTAMIESGFNPTAVSRVGAKGLWQFMAPT